MNWPAVDIVIPTLNCEFTLLKCLESLRNQQYSGNVRIMVIDGGSSDRTIKIAKDFGCEVIVLPGVYSNGVSGARNQSLKFLTGDLYWQIDSDNIVLGNKALYRLVLPFIDSENINITVPYITWLNDQSPLDKFLSFFELQQIKTMEQSGIRNNGYQVIDNMSYGITNGSLIRRAALEKVGGYDSDIRVLKRLQAKGLSRGAIVEDAKYIHFQGGNLRKWYRKQVKRIQFFGKFQKLELDSYFIDRTQDYRRVPLAASVRLVNCSFILLKQKSDFWYYGILILLLYFYMPVTHPFTFFRTFFKFLGKS